MALVGGAGLLSVRLVGPERAGGRGLAPQKETNAEGAVLVAPKNNTNYQSSCSTCP